MRAQVLAAFSLSWERRTGECKGWAGMWAMVLLMFRVNAGAVDAFIVTALLFDSPVLVVLAFLDQQSLRSTPLALSITL